MITLDSIKPGDRVWVLGWGGVEMVGTVVDVDPEIKNGRPGIAYNLTSGEAAPERWCYLDQVTDHRPVGR